MNRMNWLSLFWCILPCFVFPSDATLNMFSHCKTISTGSQAEVHLDCRNLGYEDIPQEILDLTTKRIYLSENPYVCNCGVVWFLNALQRKSLNVKIVDLDLMTCAIPENVKGRLVKDMNKNDVCSRKVLPCHHLSCSKYAKCVKDLTGGDTCVCRAGYKGNGIFCQDLDECSLGTHNCDVRQDCHNTIGSFECRCKSGLKINSQHHCDVPEPCEMLFRPCNATNEVCVNKERGYNCTCKEGFHKKSGAINCTDVNECEQKNSCSEQAWCINKIGSYQCICKKGFSGNGKDCEDIDECETGDHACSHTAICVNSERGYKCVCRRGYIKARNGTSVCVKQEEKLLKNVIIFYGGAGAAVLLIFTICCCCCCYRRKSKKPKKGSNGQLIGNQAMEANQDLLNMAMDTDPFLLQQQQVEQQMYLLSMQQQQQQQQQYMPYFDDGSTMPGDGFDEGSAMPGIVRPNESSMTTWSDDDEYAQDYDYDTYN